MRHSPGFYRRFAVLALHTEVVRGGLCLLLLAGLLLGGARFWQAVLVAFLAYGLLSLVTLSLDRLADRTRHQPARRSVDKTRHQLARQSADDAYAKCLALQKKFRFSASGIADEEIAEQLHRIAGWIDRIMQTIVEDEKYEATLTLAGLIETTDDLMTAYQKVVRRRLDGPEERVRVGANLVSLESAFSRFWERLNRDAVVDLEALNETIELNLRGLESLHQLGETT